MKAIRPKYGSVMDNFFVNRGIPSRKTGSALR